MPTADGLDTNESTVGRTSGNRGARGHGGLSRSAIVLQRRGESQNFLSFSFWKENDRIKSGLRPSSETDRQGVEYSNLSSPKRAEQGRVLSVTRIVHVGLAQRDSAPSIREGKCGPRPTPWVHRPDPNPSFAACDDGYISRSINSMHYGQLYLRSRVLNRGVSWLERPDAPRARTTQRERERERKRCGGCGQR